MVVNSIENDATSNITKKPTKKNSADFSKFLDNLGKTDKPKKSMESALPSQSKIPQKKMHLNDKDYMQHLKSLPQKNHIQKIAFESNANQSQIDTKLDEQPSAIKSDSFSPLINDSKEINNKEVKDELLKKILQNRSQNDVVANKDDAKSIPVISNTKEEPYTAQVKTSNADILKLDTREEITDVKDAGIANSIKESSNNSLINNILKDTTSKFSTISDNDIKLSLKDTLKYGAFKAFDALSLLKPSDGKKLSDLIKKADELALNLTKIQHKKEVNKPNEIDNKKTLELKNNELKEKIESSKNSFNSLEKLDKQEAVQYDNKDMNRLNNIKNTIKDDIKNINMQQKDNLDSKENNQGQKKDIKEQSRISQKQELQQSHIHQNIQNKEIKSDLNTRELLQQESAINENKDLKPTSFKVSNKNDIKQENDVKQVTNDKNLDAINANNVKNDQVQKNIDLKETFNSFARALKQEIINYKPPLSKLTLELNPANLGSIEVSVTHQGKNIQLQLNGNQNTINLFIQNQSDLRSALSQIGYENITMSFSNGSQMGFSDNSGKWNFRHLSKSIDSRDEVDNEIANLEITLVNNYA